MYAVVEISGKQYKVEEGKFIDVDLQSDELESEVKFDKVLLTSDGSDVKVGAPYLEGAEVTAKLLKNLKDKKVLVYKMRPKKGTRTKQGHRQNYSRFLVSSIKA